jgi:hypothetical protein
MAAAAPAAMVAAARAVGGVSAGLAVPAAVAEAVAAGVEVVAVVATAVAARQLPAGATAGRAGADAGGWAAPALAACIAWANVPAAPSGAAMPGLAEGVVAPERAGAVGTPTVGTPTASGAWLDSAVVVASEIVSMARCSASPGPARRAP